MTVKSHRSGVLGALLLAAFCTPLFVSSSVYAAESPIVVESRESGNVTFQPPIEEPADTTGIESQYQLQLLQKEVMELRGTVEELRYQLQQMKTIADDRYLELDARLLQALQNPVVQETIPATGASQEPVTTGTGQETTVALTEEELYNTAQQLIRNRQYDMAITQLESLIERFPDGFYTANSYYWLGQVYAAKSDPDFEKARQALAQVIGYFPDHGKVPDATFALGKVYHTLGDCRRAEELLQDVVRRFPGKSAATLAENFLRESVNCDL